MRSTRRVVSCSSCMSPKISSEVLEGDHTGGSSELVDDDGDGTLFGQKPAHHLIGHEGLRGVDHGLEMFAPVAFGLE